MMVLNCPECGNGLAGLQIDRIFLCTSCGACWIVENGLTRVPISLSGCDDGSLPMPCWKVEAIVTVHRRVSRPLSATTVFEGPRVFDGTERTLTESSAPPARMTLIFPAFASGQVLRAGVAFHGMELREEPVRTDLPITPMVGGSVGREDTGALARGVAVGLQIAARDSLAMVELELEVISTAVIAVGAVVSGSHLRFGDGELKLPFPAVTDIEAIRGYHSGRNTAG